MFRERQAVKRAEKAAKLGAIMGRNWQTVLDALECDRQRIRSAARNHENRSELKAQVIDEYLPYLDDPDVPGQLVVWLMLWMFDCRMIGRAMPLAIRAIDAEMPTPDWLAREKVAEVVADEVIIWAEDCHRLGESSAPYLDDTLALIEGRDIPDNLLGRYYRLKGLMALGHKGISIGKIEDKQVLDNALPWFEKAMSSGGKVKTAIDQITKRLEKVT